MSSFEQAQPFKILILGGSYAGLAAALNLVDLCHGRRHRFSITEVDNGTGKRIPVQVTIVDPRDGYCTRFTLPFFYLIKYLTINIDHLIGQPLALSSQEFAESFWIKYTEIPALQTPEIHCVQGSIDSLDCTAKTATIATESGAVQEKYDYLIACTGLRREFPSAPCSLTRETYLAETAENLANIRGAEKGVAVIGGGMSSISVSCPRESGWNLMMVK
jgi:NADH dehydrogenase FAD-containing subunit